MPAASIPAFQLPSRFAIDAMTFMGARKIAIGVIRQSFSAAFPTFLLQVL
jgi:hypothetical protein